MDFFTSLDLLLIGDIFRVHVVARSGRDLVRCRGVRSSDRGRACGRRHDEVVPQVQLQEREAGQTDAAAGTDRARVGGHDGNLLLLLRMKHLGHSRSDVLLLGIEQ